MNKSTEDSNIGKNDASNQRDAELDEETLEQISGGKGGITPLDALTVINELPSTSPKHVRFTHTKSK